MKKKIKSFIFKKKRKKLTSKEKERENEQIHHIQHGSMFKKLEIRRRLTTEQRKKNNRKNDLIRYVRVDDNSKFSREFDAKKNKEKKTNEEKM